MKIRTSEELFQLHNRFKEELENQRKQIVVCAGTGCVASGALDIYEEFKRLIEEKGLSSKAEVVKEVEDVTVKRAVAQAFVKLVP